LEGQILQNFLKENNKLPKWNVAFWNQKSSNWSFFKLIFTCYYLSMITLKVFEFFPSEIFTK
jgi:hypothetical protein